MLRLVPPTELEARASLSSSLTIAELILSSAPGLRGCLLVTRVLLFTLLWLGRVRGCGRGFRGLCSGVTSTLRINLLLPVASRKKMRC